MRYKHVFFDLDHTLWDFEKNSQETLGELFQLHQLEGLGAPSLGAFLKFYKQHNDLLWDLYRKGEVVKSDLRIQRFTKTLQSCGIENRTLAEALDHDYVSSSPKKGHLVSNALKVLDHLKEKYSLHIITNGFSEIQKIKLETSGLSGYFDQLITSDGVGVQKPHPRIFSQALYSTGAKRSNSVMIGDHIEVDVYGAMGVGMDAIFYNPKGLRIEKKPTHEISDLEELLSLL